MIATALSGWMGSPNLETQVLPRIKVVSYSTILQFIYFHDDYQIYLLMNGMLLLLCLRGVESGKNCVCEVVCVSGVIWHDGVPCVIPKLCLDAIGPKQGTWNKLLTLIKSVCQCHQLHPGNFIWFIMIKSPQILHGEPYNSTLHKQTS